MCLKVNTDQKTQFICRLFLLSILEMCSCLQEVPCPQTQIGFLFLEIFKYLSHRKQFCSGVVDSNKYQCPLRDEIVKL